MYKGRIMALWVLVLMVSTLFIVDRYKDRTEPREGYSADTDLVVEEDTMKSAVSNIVEQRELEEKEHLTRYQADQLVKEESRVLEIAEKERIKEEQRLARIEKEKIEEEKRIAKIEKKRVAEKERVAEIERQEKAEKAKKLRDQEVAKVDRVPQGANRGGSRKTGEVSGKKRVFQATAYDLSVASCGKSPGHPQYGITASGFNLSGHDIGSKLIAVDPNVIPLGSKIYIEFGSGYSHLNGTFTAVDTGGAIKGNRVDIFFGSENVAGQVSKFGRRDVTVTY